MKIVIAQHKGGVGKTTLATHVAGILAEDDLSKTLVMDCDTQGDSFRFFTGDSPRKNMQLDEGRDDVDVLWNPRREGLARTNAFAPYDHIVVDIDTNVINSMQVITEVSPDLILIPVDGQLLSLRHLGEVLSLIAMNEGKFNYPTVVKIVQMGSAHPIREALQKMGLLPADVRFGMDIPYLRDEFDRALYAGDYIWNREPAGSHVKSVMEEVIYHG